MSALLVVQKPQGQGVHCVDPKFLNKACIAAEYVLGICRQLMILPNMTNDKVMTTVDMRQAFWMLKLDNESS